jgi:toxin ParE1/3/4
MKYRLRILPAADADVDDAALFIAQDNLDAALRFYDAIEETYSKIRDHPSRWSVYELNAPRLAGLRKCTVARHRNYLVFYLVDANLVKILRVLHGARDIPAIFDKKMTGD